MRAAEVYCKGKFAGILTEENGKSYVFRYDDKYFRDTEKPAVSLTLPKTQQEYRSEYLFPFFFNMLSEGANRQAQSRLLKIDEKDHFGILLATAQYDTIGAITVKPMPKAFLRDT
jgi:serine/threonine-protein kinase HipA